MESGETGIMSEMGHGDFVSATDEHACEMALGSLQAFLHGELPEANADEIRHHLMICESCMNDFDIEEMISSMVKRCTGTPCASPALRTRITALSVEHRRSMSGGDVTTESA
ncbi:anti-sigma factor [Propionibacterium freudenreichii]|nr:anti-sigma factor [Propionibacterium freudenreichii subsp. freudenreichii]CEG85623.1 anti-sigma factor [Propionibacterium freudenreichii]CEG88617.1 anti-sigma factor [Propionibacterium freudenreichii]CEG96383.1 anti-sigma factor [Propionibacterium freudenreichii]CEH01511.1 anti-sigma factor [Propionibacterium freudenreichii]